MTKKITDVETDSYVAVQILEQHEELGFESLRHMAEQMEGTFTFTVLDRQMVFESCNK